MSRATAAIDSVLIVDDDPILCALEEVFFAGRGATQIRSALNGRDALDILLSAQKPIDFVLCDLKMPEMDGSSCATSRRTTIRVSWQC